MGLIDCFSALMAIRILLVRRYLSFILARNHSSSTYAKFFEKQRFP